MIKLIGALLIFAAGTAFGFAQSRRLRERPLQVRRLLIMLQQLETEIAYGVVPLPEALAKLGRQTAEPLAGWLLETARRLGAGHSSTVRDVWEQTITAYWPRTAMKDAEKETLVRLGHSLGATNRDDQLKHLRLAAAQLAGVEAEAADERRRYETMWKSLGMLGGALIVVMLY